MVTQLLQWVVRFCVVDREPIEETEDETQGQTDGPGRSEGAC